ncbi:protein PHYLLO, chloroplastic isoform X2 [Actinidia eriantha]|uniref:protein PHYLLO, chloroplastic isoform X2 n=1 Tax=Actinidia eriantha TaxID=165200 RepID=UPI0025878985|nr:protein PHYLLO, chloroplastic isoform X2 [Actinidia eriantha]
MKLLHLSQSHTLSPPFSLLQFPTRNFLLPRHTPNFNSLRSLHRSALLRRRQKPNSKFFRVSAKECELLEGEEAELMVATCITRTLPPALTLEHGLNQIEEAVGELKSNPPRSTNGMYRFQVAVPPSAKALNWFCSQPESSKVFPLFFISKEKHNSTFRSLSLRGVRGVFGIGAAILFEGSSSCASADWSSLKRYLPLDSSLVMAYGFMDLDFNMRSSSVKHSRGSFYLFIPEIELSEFEGISMLAATLVWDDSSLCTFEEAIQSYEAALHQVSHHFWPTTEKFHNKCIRSAVRKFNMAGDTNAQMVCVDARSMGGQDLGNNAVELTGPSSFCQFSVRLSPTLEIVNNTLDNVNDMCRSLHKYPNINTLWASLIIEECVRLGLTYFCVAPGSRSSPLAIAASAHPLTTCIACFDERSLAFHAVGFGRGSHIPAVVITSSGTAVSNLLPAVVEASQDFVPLLLLTADRPPELQDAGANQAINQVNHFGSFVRFFYGLPAPSDNIPARMVLTTIDSAVYWATSSPYGPVHINCPFREPLDNSARQWMLSCLKGLDFWMSSAQPFTNYIQVQYDFACSGTQSQMAEVLQVIQGANRGLLLIGAMHREDDIWAALLLAKHLSWPVVADILSGLRLRKYLNYFEFEKNFLFIDHLDHSLLSDSVRSWAQADVIVQIGSRITSKRISQMLEDCVQCSYIIVENHPSRHDPSHIVKHRIQSTITQFADCLLKAHIPQISSEWCGFLQAVDKMVTWEMAFQIHSESSLTEPYVAHLIPKALHCESAIFVGNSMPIRDADMYGHNWAECTTDTAAFLSLDLPCHWIRVAGNRGASGIDGLLSTAVGFAVGCNKQVICVIGDVSFLHDTNGLALLKQRLCRKPMTILVINNHGGAIFSLLPIAERTEQGVLDQYFYTSHDVSIQNLCIAHGVKHVKVRTKMELQDALLTSQREEIDMIIEVESRIDANASFHRLRQFACQAAANALTLVSSFSTSDNTLDGSFVVGIHKMEYSLYRILLYAPPTSTSAQDDPRSCYREGFIVTLSLEDGSMGFGEVAPLEIHQENLIDVEDQLRFLIHVIQQKKISYFLPLLKGSFSSWIWKVLGILPGSIFPSVRCGLEMAILNAIAAMKSSSLFNILHPGTAAEVEVSERSASIQICALIESNGSPEDIADIAATLVGEGFSTIKLKVARRPDPIEDARVIQEVRKKVGCQINLRADANQKWTYEEAVRFSSSVMNCDLQYIEEPVQDEDDIIKFCEQTGLPVALDETLGNITENPLKMLAKFTHSGVAAVVIKPSVVGGFENAALIARWAQQHGKMSVVSATFESSLGLSAYIQFSCYLELQNADVCRAMNKEPSPSIAHGLGTYRWLKEDTTSEHLNIHHNPDSGFMEASVDDAGRLVGKFQVNHNVILRNFTDEQVRRYQLRVDSEGFSVSFNVQEIGASAGNNVLVFLHGFLGTGEDWMPIIKAVSASARCIAVDLPGHGRSKFQYFGIRKTGREPSLSIEVVANIVMKLIDNITPGKVTLVGYSMGARIALYMALRCTTKVEGAVVLSGSPGLRDMSARKFRRAKDDSRACSLIAHGLELFLDSWYAEELWNSLRDHPHFKKIVASRLQHDDMHTLAKVLSDSSIGRQLPLWEDLRHCKVPLLLVVGEKDEKFKRIAQEMFQEVNFGGRSTDHSVKICEIIEIPNCGHAVHLENPLPVISAIRQYLKKSRGLIS